MNKRIAGGIVAVLLTFAGMGALATSASANEKCGYSQGYYKTHWTGTEINNVVSRGSADVVKAILAHTGLPDLQAVLAASPKGDPYLIAAKQWIAAAANGTVGESGFQGATGAAFYGLSTYFQWPDAFTSAQVLAWSGLLDSYNNGLLDLPHCG
jgi:hypothetical protein